MLDLENFREAGRSEEMGDKEKAAGKARQLANTNYADNELEVEISYDILKTSKC